MILWGFHTQQHECVTANCSSCGDRPVAAMGCVSSSQSLGQPSNTRRQPHRIVSAEQTDGVRSGNSTDTSKSTDLPRKQVSPRGDVTDVVRLNGGVYGDSAAASAAGHGPFSGDYLHSQEFPGRPLHTSFERPRTAPSDRVSPYHRN